MKIFLATATLFLATELAKAGTIDTMDPHAHLTEEEFAKVYNHEQITDPEELRLREEALAAAEAEEAMVNAAFLAGEATWMDKINEFSDLPADEMDDHTGICTVKSSSNLYPEMFSCITYHWKCLFISFFSFVFQWLEISLT